MKKTINGLSVFTEGDKKNKAIIFLHGFPYDHTMWQAQVNEFSETYYCIAYDIRGLGKSSVGDGQFTMESFVDDLENIMVELQLDKPIVCGFSMGGYIALRALVRMEEKFSAVILCDTVSHGDTNESKLKRSDTIRRINAKGFPSFGRSFIAECFSTSYKKENKEDFDKITAKSMKFNSIGIKGCLFAIMSRTDTTEYLSSIKIPTLLLCGEGDTITPPSIMRTMADKINKSEFTLLKNSAHMSMIENSIDANKVINKFLEKL